MSVFDRVVNLGKGMVQTWRNDRTEPAEAELEAELEAMRGRATEHTTTRKPDGRALATEDEEEPTEPMGGPRPTLDRPLKRTL